MNKEHSHEPKINPDGSIKCKTCDVELRKSSDKN